jgi:four helix bundle protein
MNNPRDIQNSNHDHRLLPHHRLRVYAMALEMLVFVRDAQVRDVKLRDEALRAAKGACLNIAEGAARVTRADKARAFIIARGEIVEACAALEIAALLDSAREEDAERVAKLADNIVAILTRLIR